MQRHFPTPKMKENSFFLFYFKIISYLCKREVDPIGHQTRDKEE